MPRNSHNSMWQAQEPPDSHPRKSKEGTEITTSFWKTHLRHPRRTSSMWRLTEWAAALLPTDKDPDKPKNWAKRNLIRFKKEKHKALHPGQNNPRHQRRLGRAGWATALLARAQKLGEKPAETGGNSSLQGRQTAHRVRDIVPTPQGPYKRWLQPRQQP